jgi:hypothetical protein
MKSSNIVFVFNILALIPYVLLGQSYKLSGYVLDTESNDAVPYASLYEVSNKKGVRTDSLGYFELSLKKTNKLTVEISHLQFLKTSYHLNFSKDTTITVMLKQKAKALNEVEVVDLQKLRNTSSSQLKNSQINILPALGGEKDVLKALQFTPGVQAGNEGSIGLNVRGGGQDQNLYLIDNMPIYSPSHLLGFFSTFNSDIIQQVDLVRAGMPANYGGKLSSLVDIKTKKPSFNEVTGGYSVGIIAAKVYAEIPIVKNKSGLMVSVRRSYFDMLVALQTAGETTNEKSKIGFYDINLKYDHHINQNNFISVQHLQSKDFFYSEYENPAYTSHDLAGIDWRGDATFMNYKHIGSNNNSVSILAGVNNYAYNFINENYNQNNILESGYKKNSAISDMLIKLEYESNLSQNINLIIGSSHTFHTVFPLRMYLQEKELYYQKNTANETALFTHLNIKLTNKDIVSVGLRQTAYFCDGASYFPLEPRLSYITEINKLWKLKTSLSRNAQFIHRVEDFSTFLPTELWYAADRELKYEENYQLSSELTRTIRKWNVDIGGAVYCKRMNNLVEYGSYYSDFPLPKNMKNHIVEAGGKGLAYGLELFCNKQKGDFNYSITYLLSKSIRKFENINSNNWYPSSTDRLHNFNTTISYKLNDKVLFSLAWVFSTGKPVTIPEGRYYSPGNEEAIYFYIGNRNNYRLANYHRLDASVQFKKIKRKGTRTWEIGLYNAYNRLNPYSISFQEDRMFSNGTWAETGKVKIKQFSLFPIIPSVTYIRQF